MKSPLAILCAVGLVGAAGTWVWRQQESARKSSPVSSKDRAAARAQDRAAARAPAVRGPVAGAVRPARVAAGAAAGGAPASPRDEPKPAASSPSLRGAGGLGEGELQRRAARVEQEANHDLAQLVGLLGIDEAQQDRIFQTLVRHSPQWLPAMQPAGISGALGAPSPSPAGVDAVGAAAPAAGGTLLDAIAADLTPDQQVELANEELDRQEWWESIIGQLLPESEVPAVEGAGPMVDPGTSPAASGPADSKAAEEPAVLE